MLNPVVIRAIALRDFRRYFSNPTGYVFITLFIFGSAAAAFWTPRFFLDNLATLDELNRVFPYLLVLFVAALTMGAWSDERKQGTDEVLLTLPATDADIVLGKYLAVLGVYTTSLAVSLSHAVVLRWLGHPDPGLIAAAYIGDWLAGGALIPVGMVASAMTSNATIAFILAAGLCSVPVLLPAAAATFGDGLARQVIRLGVTTHFADFAAGEIRLSGLLYFASLAALFLYANVVVIARRRWPTPGPGRSMALQYGVRFLALAAALGAGNVVAARARLRIDVTAEQLHGLGPETRRLVQSLSASRPVRVEAFVSPQVPTEYVQERESLLTVLRDIADLGGPSVDLIVQETEPYTDAARMARERFGIVPRLVVNSANAALERVPVFLGVAFTAGAEEMVTPFLEHGLSAEYEVARAIRVVARAERKRVGIVDTDARVAGGIDFESRRARPRWAIVEELRRQYDLVSIGPHEPIGETVDALLVALPSTLLQREMTNVFDAIARGVPALIIVDPLPAMDMRLAPTAAMADAANPYAPAGTAYARKNTGDIMAALKTIGVDWAPARIVWDGYRPHADLADLPWEVTFLAPSSGNQSAFNRSHPASSGLQELAMMYAGYLAPVDTAGITFEPLVQTGPLSGSESYFKLVQPSPTGPVLSANVPHQTGSEALTLAAHVRSDTLDAIVIADLDFVSDQFFELRARADTDMTLDNITFFLNCIDVLARDNAFLELRGRRVKRRTLERVEAQIRQFIERRSDEEQAAAAEATAAIETVQAALDQAVRNVEQRPDLDAQARQILARNLQAAEARRFELLRANIELAKDAKIQASRERMESSIRRIRGTIRTTAVLLPPLPMLAVGTVIYLRRRRRERETAGTRWRH